MSQPMPFGFGSLPELTTTMKGQKKASVTMQVSGGGNVQAQNGKEH